MLARIAQQSAAFLKLLDPAPPTPPENRIELAESFAVWHLSARAALAGSRIEPQAQNLRRWYHQVNVSAAKSADRAPQLLAMLISQEGASAGQFDVVAMADARRTDGLPLRLRKASAIIDGTHFESEPLVRCLLVPEYDITALWLKFADKDILFILKNEGSTLPAEPYRFYDFADFQALMRNSPLPE